MDMHSQLPAEQPHTQHDVLPRPVAAQTSRETAEKTVFLVAAANFMQTLGDRLMVMQLFSLLILWGPMGEYLGAGCALIIVPSVAGSILAGVLIDRMSRTSVMRAVTLMRALIAILSFAILPQLIESHYRTLLIAGLSSMLVLLSSTFTLARLAATPELLKATCDWKPSRYHKLLSTTNGLSWSATALATLLACCLAFPFFSESPSMGLRAAAVIYALSFFLLKLKAFKSTDLARKGAPRRATESNGRSSSLKSYLERHRACFDFLTLSTVLGTLSMLFYVCLTSVGLQTHRLSPVIVSDLHPALMLGIIFGAGVTCWAIEIIGAVECLALSAAATGIVASIAAGAGSVPAAQLALFTLGGTTAITLSTLETVLQMVFPARRLGTIFAVRESLMLILLLGLAVYIERILPAVSLLPMLRVLSISSIAIAVILAVGWPDMLFLIGRSIARLVLSLFFGYTVVDKSRPDSGNITHARPIILAGNHTGWLDGLIVGAALKRRVRFLVMADALKWPVLGPLIKRLGGIPVPKQSGNEAVDRAVSCLNRGESILIFPEGRLTDDGSVGAFKKGVARLHRETDCPIVPFAIIGGFEAWPKFRYLPKLSKLTFVIGAPISMPDTDPAVIVSTLREQVIELRESMAQKN